LNHRVINSQLDSFLEHYAAILALIATNPADCVKTVYQDKKLGNFRNPYECLLFLIKQEGVESLWKGTIARIFAIVPLFALTFLAFEWLQRNLQPGTVLGLSTFQEDFDLVRKNRVYRIHDGLKEDYGLDLGKIKLTTDSVENVI